MRAVFGYSSIDRMPLGDISATIHTLITFNTGIDFVYKYSYNGKYFDLDTRQFKEVLDGVPLDAPGGIRIYYGVFTGKQVRDRRRCCLIEGGIT